MKLISSTISVVTSAFLKPYNFLVEIDMIDCENQEFFVSTIEKILEENGISEEFSLEIESYEYLEFSGIDENIVDLLIPVFSIFMELESLSFLKIKCNNREVLELEQSYNIFNLPENADIYILNSEDDIEGDQLPELSKEDLVERFSKIHYDDIKKDILSLSVDDEDLGDISTSDVEKLVDMSEGSEFSRKIFLDSIFLEEDAEEIEDNEDMIISYYGDIILLGSDYILYNTKDTDFVPITIKIFPYGKEDVDTLIQFLYKGNKETRLTNYSLNLE